MRFVPCCVSLWFSTGRFNTLRPRQNDRHFPDDTFKRIFLNENVRISIKISPKFVPKCPIKKIPALVQIMAWRRPGDKPLSEPMMIRLQTHICVTRPQWVKPHLPRLLHMHWCIRLTLIPAWIRNYRHYKMLDKITYSFPKAWQWIICSSHT